MIRQEDESQEDYKKRRKATQRLIKQKIRGKWYHISSVLEPEYEAKEGVDEPPMVRRTKTYTRPKRVQQIKKTRGKNR